MHAEPSMAEIGAMIGSPARAAILSVLFDGRAMTATELAQIANVSPATGSEHLGKLVQSGLLSCARHGRHRYYRLASAQVAEILEPLVHLVSAGPVPMRTVSPRARALREARLCYDHLAGRLGVAICSAFLDRNILTPMDRDFALTQIGEAFFTDLGIDMSGVRLKRRMFAKQCLDWSEREPHLAGALGAAFTSHAFAQSWIRRTKHRRIITVTTRGREVFAQRLGITIDYVP